MKEMIKLAFFPIVVSLIYLWIATTSVDALRFSEAFTWTSILFLVLVIASKLGYEIGESLR